MPPIIGIDLGTTNSLVAHVVEGRPVIIPVGGTRSMPSIVGIDDHGGLSVGTSAKRRRAAFPEATVAEVKRLMGTSERVKLNDRTYTPTEISGSILLALRHAAEVHLGSRVEEAVVTVPAYFTDAQRQATKDAGELAGLRVDRILNEPTAAALAYGIDRLDAEEHVLVYDLGGGTFDVSVLEMFGGVVDVRSSSGNNRLGGGDFDRKLVELLLSSFLRQQGLDVRRDPVAMARLTEAAEAAKVGLSSNDSVRVSIPSLATKDGRELPLETELTRATFEAAILDDVRSTLACVDAALADARIGAKAIGQIVLVGGSSRIPLVRRLVAEHFGKEARTDVDADEAVALGAAIQAALKSGSITAATGIMLTDVAPFTLGVEVSGNAGSQRVTGLFSPIIPRNSTVPVSRTERYSTTADGQKQVNIRIFQGDSRYTKNNVFLDEYLVEGIPAAPEGREAVSITFTYDINGILNVTTEVVSTGKKASLKVDKSPRRLTAEERVAAKARLERECAGTMRSEPAGSSTDEGPSALRELVRAARERSRSLSIREREKVDSLIADAEEAIAHSDAAGMAKLDVALTDCLFDLG